MELQGPKETQPANALEFKLRMKKWRQVRRREGRELARCF
jgi:hypothetical protein